MYWMFAFEEEMGSYPLSEEEGSVLFFQSIGEEVWGPGSILHGREHFYGYDMSDNAS